MPLDYNYYAEKVSNADKLKQEVKSEIHMQKIAKVLQNWESVAPYLDVPRQDVEDAKAANHAPAEQRYINSDHVIPSWLQLDQLCTHYTISHCDSPSLY